ncbi:MAG: long-chain fatty acid--CoA ligase [Ignavibacteria bacterium]|nr:long-chain fatty acid--CoA ligase [Ignavibacteria bacterium]
MPLLKDFRTIPGLFSFLTTEYGKTAQHPMLKHKADGKWIDISYEQCRKEAIDFALGLVSLGIKRNDKIAIISENRPEWVYADMAILSLGATDVPLYPSLTADSIEFILNNSEAQAIIVSNKFQYNKIKKIRHNCKHLKHVIVFNDEESLRGETGLYSFKNIQDRGRTSNLSESSFQESVRNCKENDICTIIYTSGTTGEPKGVLLTHKNIVTNIKDALQVIPMGKTDVLLSFLPLCHIFERMAGYYTALASGALLCFAQSIESVSADLLEIRPTIMTTVPRLFERMHSKITKNIESQSPKKQKIFWWAISVGAEFSKVKKSSNIPVSLSLKHKLAEKLVFDKLRARTGGKLRFFISGGAALPRELGEFFEAAGITILEGYGLTESSPVIAVNRVDNYKFGTVGKPFPGVEVKIAPDGEILARGDSIMQGYYKNKKETEEVLKDGWLHTGDMGVFDAEGFLIITDRKKNLFKTSAGKYIAPTPIENLFLTSQFIDQFILIGDRRMFLSALIVPDFESLKSYADAHNIPYSNNDDLVKSNEIYDLLERELVKFQRSLANYERVRKFALLDKPFSLENGEITPTLKLKRKVIEERYKNLIEEMYIEMK